MGWLRRLILRLWRSWVSVSLLGGLVGTVFDLGLVICLVQLAKFNPAAAAPFGVALGSSANFAFNKLFAFRHHPGRTAHQYFRFLAGMAVAAALHAGLVFLLTDRLRVHYVLAKLLADVLVFTGGNLLILRFFVFPQRRRAGRDGRGEPRAKNQPLAAAPSGAAAGPADPGAGSKSPPAANSL